MTNSLSPTQKKNQTMMRRSTRLAATKANIYESYRNTSAVALKPRQRAPKRAREAEPDAATDTATVTDTTAVTATVTVNLSDWAWRNARKIDINQTLPAGEYYIGDICYALSDDVYDNIFGGTGYYPGLFEEKGTGRFFFVNETSYGDGEYSCRYSGKKFFVDAGVIGIVSKSLMGKKGKGGHVYTFSEPVKCSLANGKFSFTDGVTRVFIDTTGYDC